MMTSRSVFALLLCFAGFCSPSSARDITGTYIARFTNAAKMLQLVQTPDGTISGQYEEAIVTREGRLEEQSFLVGGAANGNKVTLSIKPNILSSAVSMFGSLDGDTLLIDSGFTDGSAHSETYKRDDSHSFAVQVEALRGLSQRILTNLANEQARQKAVKEEKIFKENLVLILKDLETFNANQEKRLSSINEYSARFPATTAKMSAALDYEKHLAGMAQASVKRGEIAVGIAQGEVQTESSHTRSLYDESVLRDRMKDLEAKSFKAVMRCKLVNAAVPQGAPMLETPDGIEHCRRIVDIDRKFSENVTAVLSALERLDAIYNEELRKQKAIVFESERIE